MRINFPNIDLKRSVNGTDTTLHHDLKKERQNRISFFFILLNTSRKQLAGSYPDKSSECKA